MKYYIYFLLLLSAILVSHVSYCQSADASGVKIRYCNNTGFHLDSLKIGNYYYGRLEDGASTEFFTYYAVDLHNGYFFSPGMCAKIGEVRNKECIDWDGGLCGVGVSTIYTGTISVKLKIKADVGEFSLRGEMTEPIK
jgi:hypothetical protein